MRVLMFGWEFPPHISGGLGTACFGLTQSLSKEDVKILFVIPKAEKENISDNVLLINASTVKTDFGKMEKARKSVLSMSVPKESEKHSVETIYVASAIRPYTWFDAKEAKEEIQKWNYQLAPASAKKNILQQAGKKSSFAFSGGYGKNLLEEVDRYALVAGEIAHQQTFDIIHAHDWLTYKAGIAAKKISSKPLVVHVHATEYDRAGENIDTRVYNIEKEGLDNADHIVAVSQWTKDILNRKYGIPNEKITVVHNGVAKNDKDVLFPIPAFGSRVITFLGRITYQKGPQYFIEAAYKVLQQFPEAHFVMAGSGDLLPEMIEKAARFRISSQVHFTGFLTSKLVDKIWAISDLYVMPSVSEPFGITPLEAAQFGVPVIISKQSGVAEVLNHAIKIDFWDVDALASAICSILRHDSLQESLKKNVRREAKSLTWNRAAKKIIKLYGELTQV